MVRGLCSCLLLSSLFIAPLARGATACDVVLGSSASCTVQAQAVAVQAAPVFVQSFPVVQHVQPVAVQAHAVHPAAVVQAQAVAVPLCAPSVKIRVLNLRPRLFGGVTRSRSVARSRSVSR